MATRNSFNNGVYTFGDNSLLLGDTRLVVRGRGNVATYSPVFSTTKITNTTPAPDTSAATPSAPTSASGSGGMESITGGGGVPRWALYAAAGLVLWLLWKRKAKA